jgi:uncharacterized protein YndB with AHSA1/START domain
MTTTDDTRRAFTLHWSLDATPEQAFEAWTDPRGSGGTSTTISRSPTSRSSSTCASAVVWRQKMVIDEETSYFTGGVYREIVPERAARLRMGRDGRLAEGRSREPRRRARRSRSFSRDGERTEMTLHVELPRTLSEDECPRVDRDGRRRLARHGRPSCRRARERAGTRLSLRSRTCDVRVRAALCLAEILGEPPPTRTRTRSCFFRQWLAERNLGLVPIADAVGVLVAGRWLARVRRGRRRPRRRDVRLALGSAVRPRGAVAGGGTIEEGWLVAPLDPRLGATAPYGREVGAVSSRAARRARSRGGARAGRVGVASPGGGSRAIATRPVDGTFSGPGARVRAHARRGRGARRARAPVGDGRGGTSSRAEPL